MTVGTFIHLYVKHSLVLIYTKPQAYMLILNFYRNKCVACNLTIVEILKMEWIRGHKWRSG